MTTIVERFIKFEFNRRWRINKYDTHTYYRGMSGLNMKGVDIVGIKDGKTAYLIEVKNFVDMPSNQILRTKAKLEGSPCELVLHFQEKISNTIKGISIIDTYLQRKTMLKFCMKLLTNRKAYYWTTFLTGQIFWLRVAQLIQQGQLVVVLYVLFPKELESYYITICEALGAELPNYRVRILPFFDKLDDVIISKLAIS